MVRMNEEAKAHDAEGGNQRKARATDWNWVATTKQLVTNVDNAVEHEMKLGPRIDWASMLPVADAARGAGEVVPGANRVAWTAS